MLRAFGSTVDSISGHGISTTHMEQTRHVVAGDKQQHGLAVDAAIGVGGHALGQRRSVRL